MNLNISDDRNELIRELANVNARLVASEKLKTNFLSNIRNEINNPLAAVLELSKAISDDSLDDEQIKKFARIIHAEMFNLDYQLRNIFFSAEVESGDLQLSVVKVDVKKMIKNVLASFQHQIDKKNLLVFTINNIRHGDNLFDTDSEKLHIIISNLVSNAIQYSDENKSIEIIADVVDGQLEISIKDYGLGIDPENKKMIFDRFRQGQEGSTKNYSGHGLGLSVCQSLLEIIEGELIVQTEPSNGSTFTIKVKRADNESLDDIVLSDNGNDFLFRDPNSMIF
ncbi:MAG: HAMP domain-containing sensor histidine kinase [Bacteroidota bacterium]